MKMSYVLRSREKRGRGFFKSAFIGLCIILVLASIILFAPSFFTGTFMTASVPFWKTSNTLESEATANLGFFRSKMALVSENLALKESIKDLTLQQIGFSALKDEYASLKSILGRETPQGFILAGVLVRPPQAPYDNLIIDAGLEEGIRVGDVVFASDVIVLGTVVEVFEHTSKVELYSTAGKTISGFISRTNTHVDIVGRGGGDFEVSIPRDIVVTETDIFVTSGVSGFVIAGVKAIDSRPTDSVQKVLAQSPANMSQIRWVTLRRQ